MAKVYLYDAWGGPEQLRLTESQTPEVSGNAVKIRMEYIGINPADWKFLSGKYRILCKGRFPRHPGYEGAGTVLETGSTVKGMQPGDRVAVGLDPADGRTGTWAEETVVDPKFVYPLPINISTRDAAVLPVAALTALQMCQMAKIGSGSNVLVTAASGGVGSFAVQIAKSMGARVSATASARNQDFVMSLGADRFIDYQTTPPEKLDAGWDAILDCVNAISRDVSAKLLAPGGHYVDTDPLPLTLIKDRICNLLSAHSHGTVIVGVDHNGMRQLFKLLGEGKVVTTIGREFGFGQLPDALTATLSGHNVGKIVVKVSA